jgi:hypothetical protein
MCEEVDEMEVLKQKWSIGAYAIRGFWVEDRAAIRGSVYSCHGLRRSVEILVDD